VISCVLCNSSCACLPDSSSSTSAVIGGGAVVIANEDCASRLSCCCFDDGSTVRGTFSLTTYVLSFYSSSEDSSGGCGQHVHVLSHTGTLTRYRTCMVAHSLLGTDVLIDFTGNMQQQQQQQQQQQHWLWTPLGCDAIVTTPFSDDNSFLIVVAALCAAAFVCVCVIGLCVCVRRYRKNTQYATL
jgi:hypothetical protein